MNVCNPKQNVKLSINFSVDLLGIKERIFLTFDQQVLFVLDEIIQS
jgi:hypothetical protein